MQHLHLHASSTDFLNFRNTRSITPRNSRRPGVGIALRETKLFTALRKRFSGVSTDAGRDLWVRPLRGEDVDVRELIRLHHELIQDGLRVLQNDVRAIRFQPRA